MVLINRWVYLQNLLKVLICLHLQIEIFFVIFTHVHSQFQNFTFSMLALLIREQEIQAFPPGFLKKYIQERLHITEDLSLPQIQPKHNQAYLRHIIKHRHAQHATVIFLALHIMHLCHTYCCFPHNCCLVLSHNTIHSPFEGERIV